MIFPCITLYQPWATWIIRGWKTIETRTHPRFASLKGKTILIHAGMNTDAEAAINPYLKPEQIKQDPDDMINGFIIGSAFVKDFAELGAENSKSALIDCYHTRRWGLFLNDIKKIEPIPVKGEMGIWYYDLDNKCKVKKPADNKLTLF